MNSLKFMFNAALLLSTTSAFSKEKVQLKAQDKTIDKSRKPDSLGRKSLACEATKTVNDGEEEALMFSIGQSTIGQVAPNAKTIEVQIHSESSAVGKINGERVFFEASYNPVNGHFDIHLYDGGIGAPSGSRPLVLQVGSAVADSTVSQRFQYLQWGPIPKRVGEKRKEVIFDFKCTVADWPQYKY